MTDNYELIAPLLRFESEDDFYYIQILQRHKEHEGLTKNSNAVKEYYVGSLEYLESRYAQMKDIATVTNGRVTIRLNRRSWKQCAFRSLEKIAGQCAAQDFISVRKYYSRVCGVYNNETVKRWVVDLDGEQVHLSQDIIEFIDTLRPEGKKLIAKIPSKSGRHLITSPFDIQEFNKYYSGIEIHKDNPTNLFIP